MLKKIPSQVIKNAKGLCIFTTMRTGLWVSGSGGGGILVARKEDGTWSPPSGIMMHTVGVGFLVGVDIYDCVIVINSTKALEAFQSIRCTLGGEISAVAGPAGVGGILDTEIHKRQSPLFTYIKSRGFYAGLQLDGTIVIERTDENERFYGEKIGVKDILAGKVRHPPYEVRRLMETLKSAQGDTIVDESLIPDGAPPADFEIEAPEDKTFGVPEPEDPDPFGVLALQEAGLDIREAGTGSRPKSEQFEFRPSPTSPIYTTFRNSTFGSSLDRSRMSMDRSSTGDSRRSSWRTSTISSVLEPRRGSTMVDTSTQTDMSTQTDDLPPPPTAKKAPPTLPPRQNHVRTPSIPLAEIPETMAEEATPTKEASEATAGETIPEVGNVDSNVIKESNTTSSIRNSINLDDIELEDDEHEDEPVIHEVHQATAPQVITRARVVQVAKPIPPKLPVRNPFRNRISTHSDTSLEISHVEKQSPDSTPSLMRSDSASSLSSVENERLEQIGSKLKPKYTNETSADQSKEEEKDEAFHSLPESPIKSIPGGFT